MYSIAADAGKCKIKPDTAQGVNERGTAGGGGGEINVIVKFN